MRYRPVRFNPRPVSKPQYAVPDATRLLGVQNEYFTAGAVFERREGVWRVKECAPILHWMRKVPFERIKLELLKRGCSWEWS